MKLWTVQGSQKTVFPEVLMIDRSEILIPPKQFGHLKVHPGFRTGEMFLIAFCVNEVVKGQTLKMLWIKSHGYHEDEKKNSWELLVSHRLGTCCSHSSIEDVSSSGEVEKLKHLTVCLLFVFFPRVHKYFCETAFFPLS